MQTSARCAEVEYFTIAELGEDKPMFRCDKMSATLQVSNCAGMWREANTQKDPHERYGRCRSCSIGAVHAGAGEISASPLFRSGICARCNRTGNRLVGSHICVSCWNREREYLIGKNAKGSHPKMHPKLHPVSVRLLVGDKVKTVTRPRCASTEEVVIASLRDEPKRVVFAFVSMSGIPGMQQELAI